MTEKHLPPKSHRAFRWQAPLVMVEGTRNYLVEKDMLRKEKRVSAIAIKILTLFCRIDILPHTLHNVKNCAFHTLLAFPCYTSPKEIHLCATLLRDFRQSQNSSVEGKHYCEWTAFD